MRILLAVTLLALLSACAAQQSTGKDAMLPGIGPHAARVQADVQNILRGMDQARERDERVARYGR
ncbi:MAG TPA: hypothetical protein VFN42_00475 [Acetobacteraceae bacterium]|nr:hypothetical protein [Acetobacteraceae bacterium]